ncbi:histone deacetylase family protein [Paludisphaera rhizosphaerae]|uniref:histone deacetylase family protein n=1 Tax=Paludisphaera rhizosphaerae TaxID=2711216 RepID=UPI0013EB16D2|nr:histone deacetylase [Paludisphaera rhizosphaerae]
MSVALYVDRRMTEHKPPAGHPEKPERLETILRHLKRTGLLDACPAGTVREATDDELRRVHSAGYLASLVDVDARGGGCIEADTWMSRGSLTAARLAAGAAIEAVGDVLSGKHPRAMALVRPPGHHAIPSGAMGFCLFSNVAVAAREAIARHAVNRVLIVDFDVHHGNGTQDVFYESAEVAFLSVHRFPFYPGTGRKDETGTGPGLGLTTNIPLPFGTAPADLRAAFRAGLHALADRHRPELVIISAGFDAMAEDPVGGLGLDFADFDILTRDVVDVAETHAKGRIVSVLEGGYNPSLLAGCVETHLKALGAGPA